MTPDKRQQFLQKMYEQYGEELRAYLHRAFGGRSDEAEDTAQTAFLKLASIKMPEDIHNPRAFLYTTARNLMVDRARQLQVRLKRLFEHAQERDGEACFNEPSPEQIALHRERLAILQAAVEKLPAKRRRIFVLNRVYGLSYAEIAREMNLSEQTIKRQITRALEGCHNIVSRKLKD